MKLAARVSRITPSPTLAMTATAKAMAAQGIDVVDFSSGEPDFDTPDPVKAAAEAAIRAGFTKYTPSSGIDELRQAIIDKLQTELGLRYEKPQILVSCGAKHSLYNLAEAGLLTRFHGGVSLPREAPSVGAWKERQALYADAKARIARSVAAAVPEGSTLMLGIGTTVEAVARELLQKPGLTVVTHNLHVASMLSEHSQCKVHVAGGMLRTRDSAMEGDSTVEYLQQFKVDIALLGTLGIDPDGSLRDRDLREQAVTQAMLAQARESWLVADVSKFGQAGLAQVAHLRDCKRVFTQALPPPPFPKLLQEWDIALTIAP